MRPSRGMRPMWLGTRGLTVKVQVPQLVSRRLPASPQVTSLNFTRQPHSLPPLVDQMMRLVTLKIPRPMRILTPRRLSLPTRKTRVCICRATMRPPRPSSTAECLRLIARLRGEQASAASWEPRPPFEATEMD